MLELRKALNLSQQRFADLAGIARERLSDIERGKNQATSAEVQRAIAQAVGVGMEAMNAYLDSKLSLKRLLAQRSPSAPGPKAA